MYEWPTIRPQLRNTFQLVFSRNYSAHPASATWPLAIAGQLQSVLINGGTVSSVNTDVGVRSITRMIGQANVYWTQKRRFATNAIKLSADSRGRVVSECFCGCR